MKDDSETTELRTQIAEVLGWYVYSYNREDIVRSLQEYLDSGAEIPDALRGEIVKTIGRLSDYLR